MSPLPLVAPRAHVLNMQQNTFKSNSLAVNLGAKGVVKNQKRRKRSIQSINPKSHLHIGPGAPFLIDDLLQTTVQCTCRTFGAKTVCILQPRLAADSAHAGLLQRSAWAIGHSLSKGASGERNLC
eukprot:1148151-Pelagomonas_calceolata.AAC.5